MQKVILLIILVLTAACSSAAVKDTRYISADALFARSEPSLNGHKQLLLPQGVKLTVTKTSKQETIDGKLAFWYKIDRNALYVFGGYLDEKPVPISKPLILKRTYSFSDEYHIGEDYYFFILTGNKVKYRQSSGGGHYGIIKYSKFGSFEIVNGALQLEFQPSVLKEADFPLDEVNTPQKTILRYHPVENAFSSDFDQADNDVILKHRYVYDKKTCQWHGQRKIQVHETYTKHLKEAIGYYCPAKSIQ